jgi:hypothetical protein
VSMWVTGKRGCTHVLTCPCPMMVGPACPHPLLPNVVRLEERCEFCFLPGGRIQLMFEYTFVSTEPVFFALYWPFPYSDCQYLVRARVRVHGCGRQPCSANCLRCTTSCLFLYRCTRHEVVCKVQPPPPPSCRLCGAHARHMPHAPAFG